MKRPKKPVDPEWIADMQEHILGGYFTTREFPIMANQRLHWAAKAKVTKEHRALGATIGKVWKQRIPARVLFVRYSSKLADTDGLPTAFKALRDGIADGFGVDDSPSTPIEWVYKQDLCPRGCRGARVCIEPLNKTAPKGR